MLDFREIDDIRHVFVSVSPVKHTITRVYLCRFEIAKTILSACKIELRNVLVNEFIPKIFYKPYFYHYDIHSLITSFSDKGLNFESAQSALISLKFS